MDKEKYTMTISRTTVDKLGIKLYDKATAVVAELIANSYDADAESVKVAIPLNKWLASRNPDKEPGEQYEICVEDDGIGMTPDEVNGFYLKVGTNPRLDEKRGPASSEKNRPRMGRKGIGKLAPFGICKLIEVRSAGGEQTENGYLTAHLILNYEDIVQETDQPYYPIPGKDDRTYSKKRGTVVKLRRFLPRRTPDFETCHRQLSRRFGLSLPDFRIEVQDSVSGEKFFVGQLEVEIEEGTKITVDNNPVIMEDGTKLPVSGWVAYAKHPYKNEEIAGVRIYARGKFVSQPRDFGLQAGFHGEHSLRSYLVGVIYADWLDKDDDEDLIRSDRQDILWASEKGMAFQEWGQKLLKELGKISRTPMRQKAWQKFLEKSDLEKAAQTRFENKELTKAALEVGKTIGQIADLEDLDDSDYVNNLKELVLTVAPHKMLVDKLREIGDAEIDRPLELIARIFNDAKVAEKASLGQVAMERIEALTKLECTLKVEIGVDEKVLQALLEGAPWLVDPRWTILQANQTFDNLRRAFERWYSKKYGKKILTTTSGTAGKIRPDFIMLHIGKKIEIVEIKKPDHALDDEEFERLRGYIESTKLFLDENTTLKSYFPDVHSTLICDKLGLSPTPLLAYQKLCGDDVLERKTWEEILADTRKIHEDFLERYRPT